jgi:RimJ/RimL family protein N-acetyltransferase
MSRAPLDPALLSFRPLEAGDVARVAGWYFAPHAQRWFGKDRTPESIEREFTDYLAGSEPLHSYVVGYDGRSMGLLQWARFGDFPVEMRAYGVTDPDAVNCDVLIGEPELVHRGLGAPMLRRFLDEVVFAADPRFSTCVIDPEEANVVAIRTYAKLGFTFVRRAIDPEDGVTPLHLMELRRG